MTRPSPQRRDLLDRRLITILLIVFVQMLGASMAIPILPLYAKREFALDESIIPLLNTCFFAAQFIAGPTIGRLSDTYGRVPVLIISQVGTVIAFLMIASAQSVGMLFLARALDGITGGNIVVAQAYVTDVTPEARRTESLGLVFAAFGVGFIFGPAIGSFLSAGFGPRLPFVFAAVAASIVVLLTWFILEESLTPEARQKNASSFSTNRLREILQLLRIEQVLYIVLILIAFQLGLGMVQATFALWGDAIIFSAYEQGARDIGIGIGLSIVGIGQVVTQTVLLPRLVGRYPDSVVAFIGLIGRAIGFLIFAMILRPWFGIFGAVLFAFGAGVTLPPLQSLATQAVDPSKKGFVLGLTQSATSIAIILSTFVSGFLFELTPRHNTQFWVGLGLTGLAMLPTLALIRWDRHRRKAASS